MAAFDLKLDTVTHDLVIGETSFDLELVTGAALVAQLLTVKLRAQLGEWLLDTSFGIDYFGNVLVKGPDLTQVGAEFQAAIATSYGVLRITAFELALTGRSLTITFEVAVEDESELAVDAEIDMLSGAVSFFIIARSNAGVLSYTVA